MIVFQIIGEEMLNRQYHNTKNVQGNVDYSYSELLALHLGYVEIADPLAYKGRYFFKNGKKWIHNIGALMKTLSNTYGRYISEEELSAPSPEGFGYDVEAYYLYNSTNSFLKSPNFQDWAEHFRIH